MADPVIANKKPAVMKLEPGKTERFRVLKDYDISSLHQEKWIENSEQRYAYWRNTKSVVARKETGGELSVLIVTYDGHHNPSYGLLYASTPDLGEAEAYGLVQSLGMSLWIVERKLNDHWFAVTGSD